MQTHLTDKAQAARPCGTHLCCSSWPASWHTTSGKKPTPNTLAPALSLPTCGVVHGLLLSRLSPLRLLTRPLSQLCTGASTWRTAFRQARLDPMHAATQIILPSHIKLVLASPGCA